MAKAKQDRRRVLPIALQIHKALLPVCEKVTLAGGLRREQSHVGDIDLVCCPRRDTDLFGVAGAGISGLEAVLEKLMCDKLLERDTKVPRWGEKMRRFVVPALDDLPLELYITTPTNHGYILMVRTGDEAFATALVTARKFGGRLPDDLGCIDGNLYRFPSARLAEEARNRQSRVNGQKLDCPREEVFFAHLRLRTLLPRWRNAEGLARLEMLQHYEQQQILETLLPEAQRRVPAA